VNTIEAGAEIASLLRLYRRNARRKAEDNGMDLHGQPRVLAPGKMKDGVQVLMFKRQARLPTWHAAVG